ncbi:MAG: hypothetical protein NTV68_05255 [Methanomicrobiales archaeon]|nr:hypothetical protein [Methanomicrobiales archaeon]
MSGSQVRNAARTFSWGIRRNLTNPGDEEHTLPNIYKLVSGMDKQTLATLSELYGLLTHVYQAPDIKTAEAATGHSKMSSETSTLPR